MEICLVAEQSGSHVVRLGAKQMINFCLFAGAGAPAGGPDERDPGSQELVVQQNSGLPEELLLLFLQLHVPDPLLAEGGACLNNPSLHISFPCRMHTRAEEQKLKEQAAEKCSILFPAGGSAELASFLDCKQLKI